MPKTSPGSFQAFLSRIKATYPGRWFWLLAGVGLLTYGQSLLQQREPHFAPNPNLDLWNVAFRLELVNIQNLGAALPFALTGFVICIFALLPLAWGDGLTHPQATPPIPKLDPAYLIPRLIVSASLLTILFVQLGRHIYSPLLPWLWLLSLGILTVIFYRLDRLAGITLSPLVEAIDFLWLAALLSAGFWVGSFALQDIPSIMVPDEGLFWEVGRAIASREYHPAFFDFGVYTFPVASNLLQGLLMRWFGINLWGWRFASVVPATLTVIPLYLLAREWFDRRVGVIASAVMLTSPYYLAFARLGYNNAQALFPTMLSLYFFSLTVKRGGRLFTWLAGLTAAFGFYTYPAAWLGLATILGCLLVFLIARRMRFKQVLLEGGLLLLALVVTAGPRLAFGASSPENESLFYKLLETSLVSDFYGQALYGQGGSTLTWNGNQIYYAPDLYGDLLARGLVRTLAALVDPFIVTEHFITTNLAGGFLAAIGLALGLSLSLRGARQFRFTLILTWLLVGLFFLSVIAAFPPRHTHLVTVIPAFALLTALGLVGLCDSLAEVLEKLHKFPTNRLRWVILLAGTAALAFYGLREYFIIMPMRNPPLFEDRLSWIAWRTKEPLHILIISQQGVPHKVQYHIDTRLVPHTLRESTIEAFTWDGLPDRTLVAWEKTEGNLPVVLQSAPVAFTRFATFTLPDGQVTGYAWANTDVDLQPEPPIPDLSHIPTPLLPGLALLVALAFLVRGTIRLEKAENVAGLRLVIEVYLRNSNRKKKEK